MKPIIHFIVRDDFMREELKKLFNKHNNIIVDKSNLQNINYDNVLYVSLTCCLLSSIMQTHNIYFERFKHNNILEDKIKQMGNYTNTKELYLPYHEYITIQLEENYILYTPIKYSYVSKTPINHIYTTFYIIYQEIEKYQVKYERK